MVDRVISERKISIVKKTEKKHYLKIFILTSFVIMSFVFVWAFGEQIDSRIGKEVENKESDKIDKKLDKEQEKIQEITKEQEQTSEVSQDVENTKEDQDVLEVQNMIKEKIAGMSIEEKVAQLFVITPEALTNVEEVTTDSEITKSSLERYPVGGLIYFSKNIKTKEDLTKMLSNTQGYSKEITGLPIFLSIDEEGGDIARIANSKSIEVQSLPNMSEIGELGNPQDAYEVGVTIGSYLSELGFNLDYAPVADVMSNPDNVVVKNRSFGSNPALVSLMTLKVLEGLNEQGVYGTLKHYPGHGATEGDTHEGYAYTNRTLEEMMNNEMFPFIDGIKNNVSFIMVGHISVPNITGDNTPSSLSDIMITDILRNQLGYEGIVITDALNMGAIQESYPSEVAVVKALKAGVDLLLMPANFEEAYEGLLKAVREGEIPEERINESLERILKVKFKMME